MMNIAAVTIREQVLDGPALDWLKINESTSDKTWEEKDKWEIVFPALMELKTTVRLLATFSERQLAESIKSPNSIYLAALVFNALKGGASDMAMISHVSPNSTLTQLEKAAAHDRMYQLVDAILTKRFTFGPQNQTITVHTGWVFDNFKTLFIRYFYQPFFDDVLQTFESPNSKWVILGNPGIGKSAFGLYLLFRAIDAKRSVVYVRKLASRNLFFHEDQVYSFPHGPLPAPVVDLLSKPSTVYITDSVSPDMADAFTVLITYPDRQVWYEWSKQAKALCVLFPVWDLDELMALNIASGRPLSDDAVRSRFGHCGGIARSVFKLNTSDQGLVKEIRSSLGRIDPVRLLEREYYDLESAATLKSHRLFALVPAGAIDETLSPSSPAFYEYCSVDFLSRTAEDIVISAVDHDQKQFWSKFLDASSGIPLLSVVRGRILERQALPILASGITLERRRLQADGNGIEDTITVPHSKLDSFEDDEDLKAKFAVDRTKLYNATSLNECAVDCVLPGGFCGNFTVGDSQDIVMAPKRNPENRGLQAILRALGATVAARGRNTHHGPMPIPFYFLVPHDVYPLWSKPQLLLSNGKTVTRVTPQIEQYVVCLPAFSNVQMAKRQRRAESDLF